MKTVKFVNYLLLITAVSLFAYCIHRDNNNGETLATVKYFNNGDTLLPDYAISDTLIVKNADGLNKACAEFEQDTSKGSDEDYDSLFHVYCIPIK